MNESYTMIASHAHACTNPPSPLGEPESKENRFHCTNFCKFTDQQNHKYVIEIGYNQCHNKIKMK